MRIYGQLLDTNGVHIDAKRDLPDATDGIPCCMGYAVDGPRGCTCWESVYDQPQSEFQDGSRQESRRSPCHDCAYRKGSPERTGEKGYSGDEDELFHIAATGQPFTCHQGMRKVVAYRHPSGMEVPAHPADYAPGIGVVDGKRVALKSDGTCADICGGWCAKRQRVVRHQ